MEGFREPRTVVFIDNLFGPEASTIPVFGSVDAVTELYNTIVHSGFRIYRLGRPTPVEALYLAIDHLRFATHASQTSFVTHFTKGIEEELSLSPENQQELHTAAKGLIRARDDRDLDLDFLGAELLHLQAAETLEVQEAISLGITPVAGYQLGVLLIEPYPDKHHFECFAQVFPGSYEQRSIVHTVWLVCERTLDHNLNLFEHWHSIGAPTLSRHLPYYEEFHLQSTSSVPGPQGIKQQRGVSVGGDRHDEEVNSPAADNSARVSTSADGHISISARNSLQARRQAIDLANTTPAEILSGEPGLVRQEVLLHVAQFYSNTEIFERLNTTLRAQGRPEIKSVNNITRLLSVAIGCAAAKEPGQTREAIRRNLNLARRANGIRTVRQ